jgi:hypothetical protein
MLLLLLATFQVMGMIPGFDSSLLTLLLLLLLCRVAAAAVCQPQVMGMIPGFDSSFMSQGNDKNSSVRGDAAGRASMYGGAAGSTGMNVAVACSAVVWMLSAAAAAAQAHSVRAVCDVVVFNQCMQSLAGASLLDVGSSCAPADTVRMPCSSRSRFSPHPACLLTLFFVTPLPLQLAVKHYITIIESMTEKELDSTNVKIFQEPSRIQRLAIGSGKSLYPAAAAPLLPGPLLFMHTCGSIA